MTEYPMLALFNMPGGTEWIIIGVVALLLFGKRLPDVARSFGKSIVEFKKGIRDVKDDVDRESQAESNTRRLGDGGGPATSNTHPEAARAASTTRNESVKP